MVNEKLYHGTCGAFVAYASQNANLFGPHGRIYFTPSISHAKMFADSWNTERGMNRLNEFFGEIPKEYAQGIVLEFDKNQLDELKKGIDAGAEEFVGVGPINLNQVNVREI